MKTRSLVLVALTLLSACRGGGAPRVETVVRDSLGLRITTTDARLVTVGKVFASVSDTLAQVGSPDDRPDAETLFQVSAGRFLDDGRFVVLQGGSELRFYDAHGRRELTAGSRGEGPGEYALATGLRLTPSGDIAVWDAQLARLSIVTSRGDFLRSQQLDLQQIAQAVPNMMQMRPASRWELLDTARLLVFDYSFADMPKEGPARPRVQYLVWRLDGTGADTLGAYGGIEQTSIPRLQVVVPALDPEDTYFASDERVGRLYVGDGGTSHIDRFDESGVMDLRLDLENIDRAPDAQRLAQAKAGLLEQLAQRGLESMEGAVDEMAAREDSPTFRGLATDDLGRLWVRWGQQPTPSQLQYVVFDSDGMFLGRVLLPYHERILSISAGRVLLLHRSPLGVETLGVYRVG